MASAYLNALRQVQPAGPYLLGGWSLGGVIAYEMAQQLQRAGESVDLLALFDAPAPVDEYTLDRISFARFLTTEAVPYIWPYVLDYLRLSGSRQSESRTMMTVGGVQFSHLANGWQMSKTAAKELFSLILPQSSARRIFKILKVGLQAISNYESQPYLGQVTLFRVQQQFGPDDPSQTLGWDQLAKHGVKVHHVPGQHLTLMQRPHVLDLAAKLKICLEHIGK